MDSITCGRMRVRSATWSTDSPNRVRAATNCGPMTGCSAGSIAKSSTTMVSRASPGTTTGRTRSP